MHKVDTEGSEVHTEHEPVDADNKEQPRKPHCEPDQERVSQIGVVVSREHDGVDSPEGEVEEVRNDAQSAVADRARVERFGRKQWSRD